MKFKSKLIGVLVIAYLILCVILGGCNNSSKKVTQESKFFSKMPYEEQSAHIKQYMKNKYNIDVDINSIQKMQTESNSGEEMFRAITKYNDTDTIYCWIDKNGNISDSKFINDLSDRINDLFKRKIGQQDFNYEMKCISTLNAPAKNSWNQDNVEEMLKKEDITTDVYVFVDENERDAVMEAIENQFNGVFDFCNGCCYIYFINDMKNVNIDNVYLAQYNMKFNFEIKGE